MNGGKVVPEDAATVVLVRDSGDGLEVYMTRRRDELVFLGGYHVFPGGKVDPGDRCSEAVQRSRGLSPEDAACRINGVPEPFRAFGFFFGAARELFEEAGVLIAEDGECGPVEGPSAGLAERLGAHRADLQADRVPLHRILEQEGLFISVHRLKWFAHWITPATSPRRFNTYFFVCRKPGGQSAQPFSGEVSEGVWVRPLEALNRWRAGEWKMIPPTFASLDTLSQYGSWEDLSRDFSRPPLEHPRTVWKGF